MANPPGVLQLLHALEESKLTSPLEEAQYPKLLPWPLISHGCPNYSPCPPISVLRANPSVALYI